MSGRTADYIVAAGQAALALAQERTGRRFADVPSAFEAGALTESDWCQVLDQAREDADVDGDRRYAQQTAILLAAVRQTPGCTATRLAHRLNVSEESSRQILQQLAAQGQIRADWHRRNYAVYYPQEDV